MIIFRLLAVIVLSVIVFTPVKAANIERVGPDMVLLEGMILEGDVEKMKAIVRPQDTIVLHSPGGSVSEGGNMFILLSEVGVYTYIAEGHSCASICSYVWLAGEHRRIHMEGRIGVHQMQGTNDEWINSNPRDYAIDNATTTGMLMGVARYRKAEVDVFFWAEWLVTHPDEMNWLSRNLIERLER